MQGGRKPLGRIKQQLGEQSHARCGHEDHHEKEAGGEMDRAADMRGRIWERKFDSFIDETGWAAYKVARAAFLF